MAPALAVAPAPLPAPAVVPSAASAEAQVLAAGLGEPGKKIRRIVIFYHDGTFTDYQPEQ
ncbi:hypothetical protein [Hymenobacter persicinus]|uniref:hypothetical protein n=1 Tax=Hymenobacter persicinus TaxID=2025506 RepID=UPI001F5C2B62|nr:hypothetical protein [Hymenobacter persicinus]